MAAAMAFGRLFQRFGQPRVVGEMVAGIALGPSLFGLLAPGVHEALFPAASLPMLGLAGQLGLVFYMFLVGASVDLAHLRDNGPIAIVTSLSSIAVPFAGGVALSIFLYGPVEAPAGVKTSFALFLGVCLSITAFPVLARILDELHLLQTRLGTVAISCAAVDDVTAWLMLAVILSLVRRTGAWWWAPVKLAIYVLIMLALRHAAKRLKGVPADLPWLLLAAVISAVATEWIGVHAVFGAFFAGMMVPKSRALLGYLRDTVEPFNTVVLLPLFFALTGLRTRIGLLMDGESLLWTLAVIVTAVLGKWLGAALAARMMGLPAREANALGILMNTRGLVELVVLNIGYETGLLSQRIFAMLVAMAIVTTLMTTPLLRWTYPLMTGRDVT